MSFQTKAMMSAKCGGHEGVFYIRGTQDKLNGCHWWSLIQNPLLPYADGLAATITSILVSTSNWMACNLENSEHTTEDKQQNHRHIKSGHARFIGLSKPYYWTQCAACLWGRCRYVTKYGNRSLITNT